MMKSLKTMMPAVISMLSEHDAAFAVIRSEYGVILTKLEAIRGDIGRLDGRLEGVIEHEKHVDRRIEDHGKDDLAHGRAALDRSSANWRGNVSIVISIISLLITSIWAARSFTLQDWTARDKESYGYSNQSNVEK